MSDLAASRPETASPARGNNLSISEPHKTDPTSYSS